MGQMPLWKNQKEGRFFTRIEVTQVLSGALTLPLHVLTGHKDGPTLGITCTIHGDETVPAMMVRRLLNEVDTAGLSGRICAIPVCNPLAMAGFSRQTPEQHGKTDMHEVFPGNPKGNLTQMMAHKIASNLVEHVDILIDYHCGGSGGRLQGRVDLHQEASSELKEKSLELARQFGTVFLHENNLSGTAVGYANSLGKVAFNAETSGTYLHPSDTNGYIEEGVQGFLNVLKALGMLSGEPARRPRQLLYSTKSRIEVNPGRGGYLESHFQNPDDLGSRITKGSKLGDLIDLHSFEVVEELIAPVDGYLFFSRYSGVVDAGTKAFALAEESTSRWLEG